jgi:hypothetical protein
MKPIMLCKDVNLCRNNPQTLSWFKLVGTVFFAIFLHFLWSSLGALVENQGLALTWTFLVQVWRVWVERFAAADLWTLEAFWNS